MGFLQFFAGRADEELLGLLRRAARILDRLTEV